MVSFGDASAALGDAGVTWWVKGQQGGGKVYLPATNIMMSACTWESYGTSQEIGTHVCNNVRRTKKQVELF